LTIEALAKMPPAARGSFEKPPLFVKHPQNFLIICFFTIFARGSIDNWQHNWQKSIIFQGVLFKGKVLVGA
jgi:hypothetical protein